MSPAPPTPRRAAIYYGGFIRKGGGAFSHARALERGLVRAGWEVDLVTLDSLAWWCRYLPHLVERLGNVLTRPFGFVWKGALTRALFHTFQSRACDLRIFEDIYLSWPCRERAVTVLHAVWSDNLQAYDVPTRRVESLKRKEVQIIEGIPHPVLTVSEPYAEFLQKEHFHGELKRPLRVVELGIDPPPSSPPPLKDHHSLVYHGALEARKNVMFLLEVLRLLIRDDPRFSLTIIGDGPEENRLQAFARQHRLAVHFLGKLPQAEAMAELSRHGTYVHPSVKESFSFSLLEAKLAGLPTVALAGLQVPRSFVDVPLPSFDVNLWCAALRASPTTAGAFEAHRYTIDRMTAETVEAAQGR